MQTGVYAELRQFRLWTHARCVGVPCDMSQSNPTVLVVGAVRAQCRSDAAFSEVPVPTLPSLPLQGEAESLAEETGARAFACDGFATIAVSKLFADVEGQVGTPDVVIYNPAAVCAARSWILIRSKSSEVWQSPPLGASWSVRPQRSVWCLVGEGVILLTGASGKREGLREVSALRDGQVALRGLAQSMARALSPMGIHVAHVVIDGAIRPRRIGK